MATPQGKDVTRQVVADARTKLVLRVDMRKADRMLYGAYGWRKRVGLRIFQLADALIGLGGWVMKVKVEVVH